MLKSLAAFILIFASTTTYAAGGAHYCYSRKLTSRQTFMPAPAGQMQDRNARHLLALQASKLAYELAGLNDIATGAELIARHSRFFSQVPSGYRPFKYHSERSTGYKYIILAPLDTSEPWVIAFAGTENLLDWAADLTVGRDQFQKTLSDTELLARCEFDDGAGRPLSTHDWIVTGHSLGGGLAQGFAHKVQERRLLGSLDAAKLELVTFNAFGAAALLSMQLGAMPTITATIQAYNYFLTDDPVSMLGKHIGPTYEFKMPATGLNLYQRGIRHSLNTVFAQAMPNGHARFDLATPAAPSHVFELKLMKYFARYNVIRTDTVRTGLNNQLGDVYKLRTAAHLLTARQLSYEGDRSALVYICAMASSFKQELGPLWKPEETDEKKMSPHDLMVHDLAKLLTRCQVYGILSADSSGN